MIRLQASSALEFPYDATSRQPMARICKRGEGHRLPRMRCHIYVFDVPDRHTSDKRPHDPQPERGWTVALSWTHPKSFGTAREEDRLQWLAFWFISSFGLILLGEAITALQSERLPWNIEAVSASKSFPLARSKRRSSDSGRKNGVIRN